MQPKKRMSYTSKYKLEVIKLAEESGNHAAERHFGVSEKLVSDWRKSKDGLKEMPRKNRANRGKTANCKATGTPSTPYSGPIVSNT
jgi:transposase-like protein